MLAPALKPVFKLWYNPTIIGRENIPEKGALVIACNHIHVYDQCLTIISTKRPINYMAKKEYFEGKLRGFFRFVGCIPVNRNGREIKLSLKLDEYIPSVQPNDNNSKSFRDYQSNDDFWSDIIDW